MNRVRPPHPSHLSASTSHTRSSCVAWSHFLSPACCTAAIPEDHALGSTSLHAATVPV